MANFLEHIACPKCGSRDNLGVYDDGSAWCFGCGYYKPGVTTVSSLPNKLYTTPTTTTTSSVKLPDDVNKFIPEHANRWLYKYLFYNYGHKFCYSMSRDLLIYPIFEDNKLVYWNGRYFGNDPSHSKYVSEGRRDKLHILDREENDTLVIVEDVISFLKVYRTMDMDAGCLFGSTLNLDHVWGLDYKRIVIWLDQDKAKESIKLSNLLKLKFDATSIITPEDPKCFNHAIIHQLVHGT